jgi:hypothetical protein
MSAVVKLSSKLPGDFEINGLDGIVDELIANPKTVRLAVTTFSVSKLTTDVATGDEVPTIETHSIEVAGTEGEGFEALKAFVLDQRRLRTGREPLPFDTVEIVEQSALPDSEA